eukprot:gb/GECG01016575.1/.p1 GENE.gb/GECG01016575.1/~~gb/GECG01016575.1/.p1  ORF type:complete len:126 (+),score=20.31 gb/GECG01016575.1/:1-378(+)
MTKLKAYELRGKDRTELLSKLEELRNELNTLRIAQVTGGAASKLARIGTVRKDIARVLTVLNQKKKSELRQLLKSKNTKYYPKELRPKKTRAMRRALSVKEASKRTLRQQKKEDNFPMRRFALKA